MKLNKNVLIPPKEQLLRISRVHFIYAFAFVASILVFDAWDLIAPEDVLGRWKIAAFMIITTTLVWYAAKSQTQKTLLFDLCVYTLILMDLYVAGSLVYAERGMASRAVMLFVIPIITAAALQRASALFATASLAVATYTYMAVKYFVDNFNEGYKIELYATLGFYCLIFYVVAWALSALMLDSSRQK
jgi:hypothetical protein